MTRTSLFLIATCTLALTACSKTLPVNGKMGNERFLGQATGHVTGEGTLSINSEDGDACNGDFIYTSRYTTGNGTFACQSGKTGTFQFTSDGNSGRGFGKTVDGEKFDFVFGNPSSRVEIY